MPFNRRAFITSLGVSGIALALTKVLRTGDKVMKQPIIFLGHGSPMNAILENDFTKKLQGLAKTLGRLKAILMVSAHWETQGTWLTGMDQPKTIHDFGGFPRPLFEVQYPAPGSPELVLDIQGEIKNPLIGADFNRWGLDHGTWSVLRHIYPQADVPVIQLSLDRTKPFEFHYELGKQLSFLREQGVMIMGSGNIVHNLRILSREIDAPAMDWAVEFDQWAKQRIEERDFMALVKDPLKSKVGQLSIPSPEHYLPLLYILGAAAKDDQLTFDIEDIQNGSLAMRSVRFNS